MYVHEALPVEMHRAGIRKVFGLMGEDVARLVAHLETSDIEYYSTRHEAAAVGMADGYARASGTVGVAIVSMGPGFTNSLTSLLSAHKARSPMVVLTGHLPVGVEDPSVAASTKHASKYVDQHAILSAAGVRQVTVDQPETAVADVARVLRAAQSGAVYVINLPVDVLDSEAGSSPSKLDVEDEVEPLAPEAGQISDVADLLETSWASEHPAILAGRGAVLSQAKPVLERLGETCGAVFATTLLAKSMFAGDPYDIGIMGTFSSPVAIDILGKADVLLVFGASLNTLTTFGGELCPRAQVVQFDSNPEAFGRYAQADLVVQGDVRLSAEALMAELERRGHRSRGYRSPELADRIAAFDPLETFNDQSEPGAVDPRSLLLALDRLLPKDRTVVVDPGHHMGFQANLSAPDPLSSIWPLDFSAVGGGTSVALGAALARPDRLTVLGVGDGGLMMAFGEVDTAVRYKIPLLVVVMNDSAYGAEVQFLRLFGLPEEPALLADRSFESLATAMGAQGVTVRSLADLDLLAARLDDLDGPLVVDCKITKEVRADFIDSWERLNKPRPAEVG
jgi:acetolactate synthase I/II/III large subunit